MQEHNSKPHASSLTGGAAQDESRTPSKLRNPMIAAILCVASFSLSTPGSCAPVSTAPDSSTPAVAVPAPIAADVKQNGDKDVVRLKSVPFQKVIRMSNDVPTGQMKIARVGVPGTLAKTYRVTYKDDAVVRSVFLGQHLIKSPVNEVTLAGIRLRSARALPSRSGDYNRLRELSMVATGYSPNEGSGTGRCATGMRAGYGVVAVDPRVIRLGSRLYISGYGYAVAGDTGGAIKRNRIDLGHNTYREALGIGRRHVTVYVLDAPR